MSTRLLLINPRSPESFWSFQWALENVVRKKALNPPLGLATLAALTPVDWEAQIVDENVEPVPLEPAADVVGICGMAVQFPRQRELATYYRSRGYFVVVGGSYASLCPEQYEHVADAVVAGEAEYVWPEFCRDFESGNVRSLYRETGTVDLARSPTPRFDLLKLDAYSSATVQFSRGCPFRCEFCDIIVMFGRRPRTKSLAQIGNELDELRALRVRDVFFVDDNLIGNPKLAKALLRYLEEYQRRHDYRFRFGTEVSLNLAQDGEMLALMRAANFGWVFVGIESPDVDTLREIRKSQNTRSGLLESVREIHRHGLNVLAGFIVGFDQDTLETLDRQHDFIMASGIQVAMVGLLTALPRTPLYERLEREGRLIRDERPLDNTRPATNLVPKRMSYHEMVAGYERLYERLVSDGGIAARIRNKNRDLPGSAYRYAPLSESLSMLWRFVTRGLVPGGPMRIGQVMRTLACAPSKWARVIEDWVAGLAMQNYVKRHFGLDQAGALAVARHTATALQRLWGRHVREGSLAIFARAQDDSANLLLVLRGAIDATFFRQGMRRVEELLRHTASTVTLAIDGVAEDSARQIERLLDRLTPFGDRVCVWIAAHAHLRHAVDSSVFRVVLGDQPPYLEPPSTVIARA